MNNDYALRKAARKAHYEQYVMGCKLQECTACSGSGHYDSHGSPPCAACNGTGKYRVNNNKKRDYSEVS